MNSAFASVLLAVSQAVSLQQTDTAIKANLAEPLRYHYDAHTGACRNQHGMAARGPKMTLEQLEAAGGKGECMDLRGLQLNGDNLAYPRLKNWKLAGADLRGSKLFFAHLDNADLRGANLEGFLFGYATITGYIDPFTRGLEGCSDPQRTKLSCFR